MISRMERAAMWALDRGEVIPRPVRRRLVRLGLVGRVSSQITPAGCKALEQVAPRSRWSPPPQQGPAMARTKAVLPHQSLMLGLAAVMGATAAGAFQGRPRR